MPITVPGGLRLRALCDWLQAAVDWAIVEGPKVPGSPDRLTVVSATGGPGFLLEQALDASTFQLRTRGAQSNYDDAEDMARQLDYLICTSWPVVVGGVNVQVMGRTGGPPAPLGDSDRAMRQTYVCNYYANAASFVAG